MNILMISSLGIKEKGAQSIKKTIEGYANSGNRVIFITPKKNKSRDYYYEKVNKINNQNIVTIDVSLPFAWLASKSGKLAKLRYFYMFTIAAFFKGIYYSKKFEIDIVYGYEVWGIFASYLLSKLLKKPLISRFQGTILYPIIINRNNDKITYRRFWEHRKAMRLPADLYIMTNDGTRGKEVLERLGVPKNKIKFWMNGVNKEVRQLKYRNFLKEKYNLPGNSRILITIHRLAPWKKTERALEAIKNVTKEFPNVYLFIVGDGERRKFLEKKSQELQISKKVIFVGGIPNADVPKYLNSADIYLGTYDLSNAGNPLFESMIAGLAIVALNNGTTRDFVNNGEAAILVNKEDDFGKELTDLLKNEEKLLDYKKRAQEYADNNYWTWEERINKEISVVKELVNDHC